MYLEQEIDFLELISSDHHCRWQQGVHCIKNRFVLRMMLQLSGRRPNFFVPERTRTVHRDHAYGALTLEKKRICNKVQREKSELTLTSKLSKSTRSLQSLL